MVTTHHCNANIFFHNAVKYRSPRHRIVATFYNYNCQLVIVEFIHCRKKIVREQYKTTTTIRCKIKSFTPLKGKMVLGKFVQLQQYRAFTALTYQKYFLIENVYVYSLRTWPLQISDTQPKIKLNDRK